MNRRESQEATRERLIKAAEKAFARRGFDASSVEEIAESAGFSRGAFYSNFRSKDELFVEVLKAKRREFERALDDIMRQNLEPASRLRAVMDWYVNMNLDRDWIAMEAEFTLRALRARRARSLIAQFNRQRLADYAALVSHYFADSGTTPAAPAEAIAAALFAAAKGLNELVMFEPDVRKRKVCAAARDVVFKQLLMPAAKNQQRRAR
jgi:AcrR family transcriptional regulator